MDNLSDLRLSKNMKYTALYWAMRFFENEIDIFGKTYSDMTEIVIDSDSQEVFINKQQAFKLNSHQAFVELECLNRLLSLGYKMTDIDILPDDKFAFKGFLISFIVWDDNFEPTELDDNQVIYKSRLVSGVLEYKTIIKNNGVIFDYGLFERKDCFKMTKSDSRLYSDKDFVIHENRLMKYIGTRKKVVVPEGITELESSSFWDNQYIEEVVLPDTLLNMGGDTFFNCKNLQRISIPKNVSTMGNNPFAGCPLVEVMNESPYYKLINGALYTSDMETMIYCSISGNNDTFVVPDGVKVICKHTFFLCDRLKTIDLPSTLQKMENNPFSGCSKLSLINHSKAYFIKDDVIYNGFRTAVVGSLNKISSDELIILEGVKTINRNSFWNCKGISKIVFPKSLVDIGYNPFVGCSNINFVSKTPSFCVVDGILFNKDKSKIICYPAWKAVGHVCIPESVTALERGTFSGCDKMTSINLHNINIINKSCFTNCVSLETIYISDFVTYVGEWAFAYCENLKSVSVNERTVIDNNAFSNCQASIIYRKEYSNYVIESENLYTLKGMKRAYGKRIDSILIDPPYNSNIDYIGYKDSNYSEGYLSFMKERLSLAYQLLSEKGFMVINIDDGECDTLLTLSKEIFGSNLVSLHKWKKKNDYFDKNRVVINPKKKQTDFEYIIICKKTCKSQMKLVKQPYLDNGVLKEKDSPVPETFDYFGTTSSAKDEMQEIFGSRDFFSTPKPAKLMKELVRATTDKNSIVLDFFAGSGTVGQAVEELNNEDKGSRKFILVSNSESDICEKVTVERIKHYCSDYIFIPNK